MHLRVLLVEDEQDDAALLMRELRRRGYDVAATRVQTAREMTSALRTGTWDVVISDYNMPQFSGLEAYELMKGHGCDLPFILVSGVLGEERAVEALKAGVHDYIVKGKYARLGPAIERELKEAKVRKAQRLTQERNRQLVAELGHLAAIVRQSGDAIVSVDAEANITQWNRGAVSLLDYEEDEIRGQKIWKLFPDVSVRLRSALRIGHSSQCGSSPFETTVRRKDGRRVPVSLSVTPISDPDGRTAHLSAIIHDISERVRAEAERRATEVELRQAQKLKSIGQLSAGVAHELNTPIQYIGDNMAFLKQAFETLHGMVAPLPDILESLSGQGVAATALQDVRRRFEQLDDVATEIPRAIDQTIEGIQRVASIVRAMKEFAYPARQGKTPTDIHAAIDSTVTVARHEWKDVAIVVRDYDPDMPRVPCAADEFNQTILNLIVNAAHAIKGAKAQDAGRKGLITIRTRHVENWAEIRVSDNGTGVPAAVRSSIFDPFFTTKPVGEGTGHGLTIAYAAIVNKHGGTLNCETVEGQGTDFIIRLPLREGSLAEPGAACSAPHESSDDNSTVTVASKEELQSTPCAGHEECNG